MTSGPLVSAGGLRLLLTVHAAVTVAVAVAMLAALRLPAAFPVEAPAHESLGWLRHDRLMWKLAALLFIGVGVFNAIATWLDSILTKFGHGSLSGPLIGLTTVAGIAGAAVLPGIVTKRDKRRGMLARRDRGHGRRLRGAVTGARARHLRRAARRRRVRAARLPPGGA